MLLASVQRVLRAGKVGYAYARMDAIQDFSYPMSIVLQQGMAFFPVVLYFFIAQLVPSGRASATVGGDYYTFAVIGLALAAMMQGALSGFGGRLELSQSQGTLETLLVEPVPWIAIPFAMNIWRTVLGITGAVIMLVVAAVLGADFRVAGLVPLVGFALLAVLSATAIGILSASLMVLAKRSQTVLSLYSLAASLLGGALFPVSKLPGWLRPFSYLIPHTYVLAGAREVLMHEPPAENFATSGEAVAGLLLFTAIVMPIGLLLFSRSLQYARRMGMLSGY